MKPKIYKIMTTPKAPPAPEPENNSVNQTPFLKLVGPAISDAYPAQLIGYDFLKDYKQEYQGVEKISDCIVLYFGGASMARDQSFYPWVVKSYPMTYSVYEKARYARWLSALTGEMPKGGSVPDDFIGGECMVEVEVVDKVSKKGREYKAVKLKNVSKLPSCLAGQLKASLTELQGVLNQARAEAESYSKDKEESGGVPPEQQKTNNQKLAEQAEDLMEDVPF